jgi:putative DNA primase/helicase
MGKHESFSIIRLDPRQPAPAHEIVTEDSAALRFAEMFRDKLRYCHDTGAWFVWTGTVWQQDKTGLAFNWSRDLARELAGSEPDKVRYVTSKTSFAAGVERFSRYDPIFAVTMEAWDSDPFLLGTPGGTVELRTGVLRQSNPSEGLTKSTAVAPAETVDCPLWLAFLEEATGGDHELIRFLQQWAGYALTADTREHALVFIYGLGGNGKSVFLNALTGILATYAVTAAMDTFTASKGDKHPTDLAMLRGARLVTASETDKDKAWAESRIKHMTGGDPISARFMRQDFFTFRPNFKLTIIGNHKPVLKNVDDAERRRFNIVPFNRKPAVIDRQLEQKLRAEWPGILKWMIEGCLDWQANGLVRPSSVAEATETYFADQDLFSQWLDDECEVDIGNPHKWDTIAALYSSWALYAKNAGEEPGTVKAFGPNMLRKGLEPKRTKMARGFSGIRLKPQKTHEDDR